MGGFVNWQTSAAPDRNAPVLRKSSRCVDSLRRTLNTESQAGPSSPKPASLTPKLQPIDGAWRCSSSFLLATCSFALASLHANVEPQAVAQFIFKPANSSVDNDQAGISGCRSILRLIADGMANMHKTNGRYRRAIWAALAILLAGAGGCTRSFYRESADREVNDILAEKDKYPQWKIEQYHVYPDARSRYADPTNPDRPPMPPDDEAAWKMSPHPQKPSHKGVSDVWGTAYLEMIKQWDEENRTERQGLNVAARGAKKHPVQTFFDEPLNAPRKGFLLKMDQSIELGVINSPTYQNFREELFLTTLPVTQQRFSFAYQWAAIADFIRQYAGPASSAGPTNNWTAQSSIGFNKLFATGALLSADFINTTAFNFGGAAHGLTSGSTINVTAAQPFLQGGGKAVVLEPLTQAERNLFYSIRAFARFREQYNVGVALGATLPSDLASAAGTNTGTNPISILAALGIASTDVSGGFVGYLSTLYRECDMAADKKWVQDLQRALKILEAYQEGGMYSPLQVDQTRSTLLQAQNTVLTDEQFVINALDQFKLVLGLPANLPLILDDTPARPITNQFDAYYAVIDDADAAQAHIEKQDKTEAGKLRAFLEMTYTTEPIVQATMFQKRLPASWAIWSKLTDKDLRARVFKLGEERRKLFDLKTDLELKEQTLSPQDAVRLREVEFESDLGTLEQELRRYEGKPWEKIAQETQRRQEQVKNFRIVAAQAKNVLVWARNERFEEVGQRWPTPPGMMLDQTNLVTEDVDKAQELAVQAALTNRFDLMNARAQVVDAWRQIKVTANALMGVATVQYTMDSQTPPTGAHPLAFTSAGTNQALTFNFQLPLNRLAQRNAYRTAQINYQVARRSLLALEDNIAAQVRFDVRQLQLFAANYRIQKKVIHSLYSQVESALEVIVAPSDPDQLKASGTTGQANAAALTSQYLTALSGLNGAQTRLYDIWLSFYATRMQLYLDLEKLPLDPRGVWVDDLDAPPAQNSALRIDRLPKATPTAQQPAMPTSSANSGRPVTFLTPRGSQPFLAAPVE
jgi:hypothetical protein